MRKFLKKTSLFLLLLFVLSACGFYMTMEIVPPNENHYLYAHHNKMARLDTLSSPRIIFVGGSNLAFGLNSKRIADSLHINVQNTALHAAVGLRFMVDEVIRRSRNGDIIVIMPEYQQFTSSTYYGNDNGTLTGVVNYSDHGAWQILNIHQMYNVFGGFMTHLRGKLDRRVMESWAYYARNFNEWGDEAAHWTVPSPGIGSNQLSPVAEIDDSVVRDFVGKLDTLKARGCRVLLYWPITIKSNYLKNQVAIEQIEKALASRNTAFDCAPDYFVQPDSLAFDTPYHMSGPAVEADTDRMLALLNHMI